MKERGRQRYWLCRMDLKDLREGDAWSTIGKLRVASHKHNLCNIHRSTKTVMSQVQMHAYRDTFTFTFIHVSSGPGEPRTPAGSHSARDSPRTGVAKPFAQTLRLRQMVFLCGPPWPAVCVGCLFLRTPSRAPYSHGSVSDSVGDVLALRRGEPTGSKGPRSHRS